ncbi:hypothetical protein BMS3Abin07_01481 [bacterium BMS3Abin07]|nr:hypothetical protein BMS3Abin07_01481 [bacterium BMS3Abin07]GBE33476.1 hypothetical protein BMS3Bbin05_02417 [bacterium BMS3Bbin05]HDZ88011.1 hypothetical protein [Nitrospirota bacterium]
MYLSVVIFMPPVLFIDMQTNEFIFTGIICKEGERFTSLCPELDVASEGDTVDEASTKLLEAVTLYLETAIEANLPFLRPVPQNEDPRTLNPEAIIKIFNLKVDFQIKAYA